MGVQITEQYELTHASRKSMRTTALSQDELDVGLQGRRATGGTGHIAAHGVQYPSQKVYTGAEDIQNRARVRGGLPKELRDETESMRGLTSDVIHERREFTLEFANEVNVADEEDSHSSLK
jgi:uncharacterized protein YfaP (DUF2135 family)